MSQAFKIRWKEMSHHLYVSLRLGLLQLFAKITTWPFAFTQTLWEMSHK